MAENSFQNTVEALFKGMDSFITTKTVVGDAITVGDTIILPLVDVSFGVEPEHLQKAIKTTEQAVWVERFPRQLFW